jgi:hypothetical protein
VVDVLGQFGEDRVDLGWVDDGLVSTVAGG